MELVFTPQLFVLLFRKLTKAGGIIEEKLIQDAETHKNKNLY
jgi:hypothetical protein